MKKLNGTFQIGDLQITDLTYYVNSVNDNIKNKTCNVEVIFEDERIKHSRNLDGFTYELTWEDSDVEAWVDEQLTQLKL